MRRASPSPAGTGHPDRRRHAWPLRTYLGALLALFVVAATLALWSGWVLAEHDGLTAARADARFGAGKAAEEISQMITTVRSTVAGVAGSPGVARVFRDPASCQLAFSLGGPAAGHLDVLRSDGTVVCSSQPPTGQGAAAYRGAPWVAAGSGAPELIDSVRDARTGRPAALVRASVPGQGIVVAFVDLAGLGAVLGDTFAGPRGLELLVTTGDGATILTRSPDATRWAGTGVPGSRFTGTAHTAEATDVTGRRRVYASGSVPGTGWRVYAGADRAAALAGAHRLARRQAVLAAVGLLAGLLATLLVYRRITRPIARLRTGVQLATASGYLEPAAIVTGPREVTELGADFTGLLAAVDRELADRRRAEEAAREHERTYRQMFDTSPYPVYLFDVETLAVVAGNDAAVRYFGADRAALLGSLVTDLCPADDADVVRAEIAAAGPVEHSRPRRHRRHDGTVSEVEVTSHVTTFARRSVRCAVVEDVTERQQLQWRLRQSERLESLGQLAGGIAHDFNNLLGIINGYAAMSAADVETLAAQDPTWARLHDDLLQIVAAGDRAAGLTRQLLAFARSDAVAEPRPLDLNTVVADVEKLLRRTLGEDITLVTRLTAETAPILADVGRLEQVLVNLAVNARDAMPHGGTLTIDTAAVTVDEHYAAQHPGARPGRYLRLGVSDTGTGMSKETIGRAFEPFFTTKPKGQGTGLGLATIYGIITQAGGHVQIYSEPGQGTTIAALLPTTDRDADATPEPVAAASPGAGERVLLVEDDDGLRTLTERILQANGYTVVAVGTVLDALDAAAVGAPDLLLTDVVLPDRHGPELAAELLAEQPGLRIVYMSGYSESIMQARGSLPAESVLLSKPVTARHLLTTIAHELRAVRTG